MKNKTRLIFIIIIAILIILFTYKIYAPYSIQHFNAVNLKNIKSIKNNVAAGTFSFVILGNIENSISIFNKNILQELKGSKPGFIISTGNNVVDSGEGKYRVLYRTLQKMNIPFVTGVGENEIKENGYKNFYKYFGPFYFSFTLNNSYFIFLDTTGHSSDSWQREWLEKELKKAQDYERTFVIMNKPPLKVQADYLLGKRRGYILNPETRRYYQDIFSVYGVTAVFSSNIEIYHRENIKGVNYIISGGAGGELLVESPASFYHYVRVTVGPSGVKYQLYRLTGNPGFLVKFLVNIWVALQSFLYTNYINLIIIALIMFMIGFLFYRELNREIDYYRDFKFPEKIRLHRKLKIAMFTNNYFPVIGGVPISINRLAKGLRELGHEVYIFAPRYPGREYNDDDPYIIRCKLLCYFRREGMDMPVCNIFKKEIEGQFRDLNIDLVHSHHPFLLGSKGLSLARKYQLPAVFTYHTRLEKYAHYIPGFLFMRKIFANRIAHLMIKHFANRCNAIFAPTDTTREYLRNIGVRKLIKVLPTGVNLKNYSYESREVNYLKEKYVGGKKFLLLTVSRLSKEKNLYFLLDGLAEIKKKTCPPFNCLIIGDGPERENLEKYVIKKELEDYVTPVGTVDYREMGRYYLAADIFVFASITETQGMVLLEAMAGGTPAVAIRSSGTDDVIKNGFNGFKTGDDIDEWAAKVIELMNNRDLLEETAVNARKIAEKHSLSGMAREAEEVYKELIWQEGKLKGKPHKS